MKAAGGITRRTILRGAAGAAAVLSLEQFLAQDVYAQTVRVRPALETAAGRMMVELYRKGVEKMRGRTLAASHPHSWSYQANIHDYPADTNVNRVFAGRDRDPKIKAAYELAMGGEGKAGIWRTCSHFHNDTPSYIHFLSWHRMYLYFFERVIEKLVGEPFAMPYWNYTNPAQRSMPRAFAASRNNPLYYEERNDDFLSFGLPADAVRAYDAFIENRFHDVRGGFNRKLELRPHNIIHGAVGTPEGMGDTPKAARDPLFWVHHCNVDRLWESWREKGPNDSSPRDRTVPAGWADKRFDFAGLNGERVTMSVGDVLKSSSVLKVRYDSLEPLPRNGGLAFADSSEETQLAATRLSKSSGSGTLSRKGEITTLDVAPAVPGSEALGFAENPNTYYDLVIDVEVDRAPGALYEVYIDALKTPEGTQTERVKVDTFSLFGSGHGGHHAGALKDQWRGDITSLVRRGLIDPQKSAKVSVKVIYADPAAKVRIINVGIDAE